MRSFTSSFDRIKKVRTVPEHPWARIGVLVAVLTIAGSLGWEGAVRAMGYGASYADTPGLWAMSRDRLARKPDAIAIVGASRIRFDLDHDIASEALGGAPVVNLSMNGSVARPQLASVAEDENFRGIVLCGYTPGLFWAAGGPPLAETIEWVEAWPKRTPSAKLGQLLTLAPESLLAFVGKQELTLPAIIRQAVSMPNREGLQLPPRMPPYFQRVLLNRREIMWGKMETDTDFQQDVKSVWQGLFPMMRALPPDLLAKLRGEVVADVEKIRARGGEVIFIRFPSTGWVRDFENENFPREVYWEPLLAESGCIGIHFEDYPELTGYDCPEWSHLTGDDALKFSKDLMRIVAEKRLQAAP